MERQAPHKDPRSLPRNFEVISENVVSGIGVMGTKY